MWWITERHRATVLTPAALLLVELIQIICRQLGHLHFSRQMVWIYVSGVFIYMIWTATSQCLTSNETSNRTLNCISSVSVPQDFLQNNTTLNSCILALYGCFNLLHLTAFASPGQKLIKHLAWLFWQVCLRQSVRVEKKWWMWLKKSSKTGPYNLKHCLKMKDGAAYGSIPCNEMEEGLDLQYSSCLSCNTTRRRLRQQLHRDTRNIILTDGLYISTWPDTCCLKGKWVQ